MMFLKAPDSMFRDINHCFAWLDADHLEAKAQQNLRHPPGPASDFKHSSSGHDVHRLDKIQRHVHIRIKKHVSRSAIEGFGVKKTRGVKAGNVLLRGPDELGHP